MCWKLVQCSPLTNIEFHLKYDFSILKLGLGYFCMFFFKLLHVRVQEKSEKKKVLGQYDNIRKEKPAENHTRITFAASYREY